MGTINSRRMDSDNDNLNFPDSGFTVILQYLIRSGQVRIVHSDGSDDEVTVATQPPRVVTTPNTSRLDKSEISLATKQACGLLKSSSSSSSSHVENLSIPAMLEKRALGANGFSRGQRCFIGSNFLPNNMDHVIKYQNKIFCGTFSKNGKFFLTAGQDRVLRLFRTDDGDFTEFKQFPARDVGWSILNTAFSPDGNHIVYSSWSESLYVCSVHGNSNTQETLSLCPEERRFCLFSFVFSNDGREILGGANDGFLYIYDRHTQQRASRIEGHDDDVNSVAFADETCQIVYSAGDDGLCKVWDRRMLNESDPRPVGILAGHMDGITFVDPHSDGRHLITNSKDQTIKLWDVRVFSDQSAEENTRKAVANQNWDYRWQHVPKKLYRSRNMLDGDTSIMTYRGHSVLQTLIRCHFSPALTTGQRYIYSGCASGRVIIYDVLTGKIVGVLIGHKGCVRDVSWHPYRQEIVSTSWDGTIACWRYSSKSSRSICDYEDSGDAEESERIKLRRSERIAAQKAKQTSNPI